MGKDSDSLIFLTTNKILQRRIKMKSPKSNQLGFELENQIKQTNIGSKFEVKRGSSIYDMWVWSKSKLRARINLRNQKEVAEILTWISNGCRGNCFPQNYTN